MVALVVRLAEIWLKSHQIEKGMKNNPWDEKEPIEKEKKRKYGGKPVRASVVVKTPLVLLSSSRLRCSSALAGCSFAQAYSERPCRNSVVIAVGVRDDIRFGARSI